MNKIDFKKTEKALYSPSAKEPSIIDVPTLPFLMIDGRGDPNTAESYQQALRALYSLSYALKFMLKKAGVADYVVTPLEGLWWVKERTDFSFTDRRNWQWTSMMRQPKEVTAAQVQEAIAQTSKKKDIHALELVRFERYTEGTAAQIMHLGTFSEEPATIAKLYAYIHGHGYRIAGKHHEIYLTNFNRVAPEKLKTVIRYPISK
jgi:hypothetical protein